MDTYSETVTNSAVRFYNTFNQLVRDDNVRKMQNFGQHNGNNTLQHCENVARCSFYLAQKLGWKIDEEALATGAMLHDYYLYCTRDMTMSALKHGTSHPATALHNAGQIWNLNKKEQNIILSHMWPLTPTHLPLSKEAWLVTLADKYCALREFSASENEKEIIPGSHTPWVRSFIKRTLKGNAA